MKSLKYLILPFLLNCSALMALSVSEITDVTPKADEPPVPLKAPPPKYPEALIKKGIDALVLITVVIDENGNVVASEIKKSSNEEFNSAALEAVATWKFKPAKVGKAAVKVRVSIPIHFSVEG